MNEPVASATPSEAVRVAVQAPVHLIFFYDSERRPEIFAGAGATAAAHQRFDAISGSWNADLFVKIKSNNRNDPYANANAALASPTTPTEGPAQTHKEKADGPDR